MKSRLTIFPMVDESHSQIDEQQKRLDALDANPDDNKIVFGTKDYADTYIQKVDDFQDFVKESDVPDELKTQQFEDVAKFLKGVDTGTSAFIEQLTGALTIQLSDFREEVTLLEFALKTRHEVKRGDTVSKIVENKLGIKWKDDPARFFAGVRFLQDKRQDPGCVLTIQDGKVKWEAGPSDPNHLDMGEYFVTEGLSAVTTGTSADADWYLGFSSSAPYERALRREMSSYVQAADAGASAVVAAQTVEEARAAADSASDAAEAAEGAAADLGTAQQVVAHEAEAVGEAAEDALAALESDVTELESPDDVPTAHVLGGDDDLDLADSDPDQLEPFTMDSREQPTGFGRLFEDNDFERVVGQYTLEQQMEMIADASESHELSEQQQLRLEQLDLMASALNTYLDLLENPTRGTRFVFWLAKIFTGEDNFEKATMFLRDTLSQNVPEWSSTLMNDPSVSLESLMKRHVGGSGKSLFDAFASARTPILFTDVTTREDLLVQHGQMALSLRQSTEYEAARLLMEDALEEEFAAGREKLNEEERRAAREEAVRTVSSQASKLNVEALWTEQGLSTSDQEEIIRRLVDAEQKRLMNAKVAESFLEDGNFQRPEKLELWKQYKDMLDPQGEFFNLTDEHAHAALREVLINAGLIIVSGGVASVGRMAATKGLSLAARALIGSARLAQIERGLVASGRAGQSLLRVGGLTGKAAGLAFEGFLFEATHLGLQGEWLLSQEDWVQRTIMSAATLGAFKFAGGVGARANATLTRYVTRVPDASLRAGVQHLLVAGHTEVAAMLMIGAVQKGYVSLSEGEKMEWDWTEELIHAYVAISALKINAGAISSAKKAFSPPPGGAPSRAPRRSWSEIREARRLPRESEEIRMPETVEAARESPFDVLEIVDKVPKVTDVAPEVRAEFRASIEGAENSGLGHFFRFESMGQAESVLSNNSRHVKDLRAVLRGENELPADLIGTSWQLIDAYRDAQNVAEKRIVIEKAVQLLDKRIEKINEGMEIFKLDEELRLGIESARESWAERLKGAEAPSEALLHEISAYTPEIAGNRYQELLATIRIHEDFINKYRLGIDMSSSKSLKDGITSDRSLRDHFIGTDSGAERVVIAEKSLENIKHQVDALGDRIEVLARERYAQEGLDLTSDQIRTIVRRHPQNYMEAMEIYRQMPKKAKELDEMGLKDCAEELLNFDNEFSRVDGALLSTPEYRLAYAERLRNLSPLELKWYRERPRKLPEQGSPDYDATAFELKNFTADFVSEHVLPALIQQNVPLEILVQQIHTWQTRGSSAQLEILGSSNEGYDISGRYREVRVRVGDYTCPPPARVPEMMRAFSTQVESFSRQMEAARATMDPKAYEQAVVRYAAFVQQRFVDIHPMRDGNGRTSRMLYEYIVVKHLGPESRYRRIPMDKRSGEEPTMHGTLQDYNGDFQRKYLLEDDLLSRRLQEQTFDEMLTDFEAFGRQIQYLVDQVPST